MTCSLKSSSQNYQTNFVVCLQPQDKASVTPDTIEENIIEMDKDTFLCALCHSNSKRRCDTRKHIRVVHLKERNISVHILMSRFNKKVTSNDMKRDTDPSLQTDFVKIRIHVSEEM